MITGRNKEKAGTVREENPEIVALVFDASEMEDTRHIINHIRTNFGQLCVLFANAGMGLLKPFQMITEEDQCRLNALSWPFA